MCYRTHGRAEGQRGENTTFETIESVVTWTKMKKELRIFFLSCIYFLATQGVHRKPIP